MYGAILGDLAGSVYEFNQTKEIKNIKINNLIEENSFYSDDSILTIAVLDAILNDKNYEKYLKEYAKKYMDLKPNIKPYFNKMFSPGFTKWVSSNEIGHSIGNGAMMRISPVGYLFNTEEEVIENARLATISSHNTEEAINCATTVALIIYYARLGLTKEEIIKKLNIKLKYEDFESFNVTCYTTIDNCLYALFTTNSLEEAIRTLISYGGDTDTNACIVGSMCEAIYGIDEELIEQINKKIPDDFKKVLRRVYDNKYRTIKKRFN